MTLALNECPNRPNSLLIQKIYHYPMHMWHRRPQLWGLKLSHALVAQPPPAVRFKILHRQGYPCTSEGFVGSPSRRAQGAGCDVIPTPHCSANTRRKFGPPNPRANGDGALTGITLWEKTDQ